MRKKGETMASYIDADALREKMFHEAFEKDSPYQKWDSGCWIRYHMFENAIDSIHPADVVEVVRCKDCVFHKDVPKATEYVWCELIDGVLSKEWFCADGERKEDYEKEKM